MNLEEFRANAHRLVDWMADYYGKIEEYTVKSQVKPGDIIKQIPTSPPDDREPFDEIMKDVERKIMPGMTHWQHPNFHAYFPGNSSFPSILGEMMTSTLAAQCMIWETSPAAAELEEQMMNWFREMMKLPDHWHGVIQDTASTGTLVSLLCAREWKCDFSINKEGFGSQKLRIYCSAETHSSIAKAVKIAGFGEDNLVKMEVNDDMSMNTSLLEKAIENDLSHGHTPCAVVSTLGTTGTLAFDDVVSVDQICKKHKLWHHVDAAYAGSALVLEEYHHLSDTLEKVDSFLFNPHKWMMTNFDCSVYYASNKDTLLRTLSILPEYLKTSTTGKVNDYRDWGIPLGRRFRALKLWFVIRTYGVSGIRKVLRNHIEFAAWLEQQIQEHKDFELVTERRMNVIVFRHFDEKSTSEVLNEKNEKLLKLINDSGKAYLTHTKVQNKYVLRIVLGQTYLEKRHVENVWRLIQSTLNSI